MALILSIPLVLVDDVIDEEASLTAFETALSAFKQERELEASTIASSVEAVFDLNPGASVNMPYLVNTVLRSLNVQPANYQAMEKKVHAFISSNSDRLANKAKGIEAEPERTRPYGIKKGAGGGVVRWSDVPVKTETK